MNRFWDWLYNLIHAPWFEHCEPEPPMTQAQFMEHMRASMNFSPEARRILRIRELMYARFNRAYEAYEAQQQTLDWAKYQKSFARWHPQMVALIQEVEETEGRKTEELRKKLYAEVNAKYPELA